MFSLVLQLNRLVEPSMGQVKCVPGQALVKGRLASSVSFSKLWKSARLTELKFGSIVHISYAIPAT